MLQKTELYLAENELYVSNMRWVSNIIHYIAFQTLSYGLFVFSLLKIRKNNIGNYYLICFDPSSNTADIKKYYSI